MRELRNGGLSGGVFFSIGRQRPSGDPCCQRGEKREEEKQSVAIEGLPLGSSVDLYSRPEVRSSRGVAATPR